MSQPSHWPLPEDGIRFVTPGFLLEALQNSPLARDCYPSALGYYPAAQGHGMGREKHDDNLLIFCVDGEGRLETRQHSQAITAGDLLLIPANTPHYYEASREVPWTIYWCHFSGQQAGDYVRLISGASRKLVLPISNRLKLIRDFQSLLSVRETGYRELPFIHAANQLKQMLSYIALQNRSTRHNTQTGFNLQDIEDVMRANLDKSLSLEELAAECQLSKYHFSAKYKDATGYSPIKHFLHMKIEAACQLLDSTDLRISAVSAAVGYDDPLYFSRLFRKITGTSPKDYRASHKK
ncbi:AraC family transcriptional regulator [Litorivivens sp.]|uniref:AraC family transcriptional regulator n=1 Tax=Litorivivens sp. TaxID=2020868 RepID=UPI00356863DA